MADGTVSAAEHTPAIAARSAAGALDSQAEYIAAGSDLAHRTANLARALILWGRACDVVRRAHPASVAAEALEKLAREQEGGVVTSREEAVCAVGVLYRALPGGSPEPVMVAHTQRDTLRGSGPIPSAILRAWATAWRAFAEASNGGLPPWPRRQGVPRSPHELSVLLARVEGDSAAVQALADDVRRWAREYDEQTEVAA